VVEKITRENEIAGSNRAGHVASEKCHDLGQERMGNDRWGLPPLRKKLFAIFRDFIAVYMFPLSWVKAAHGKYFCHVPEKSTWQTSLYRLLYAERTLSCASGTRQIC